MASFDSDAFDTDAFDTDAWFLAAGGITATASDGGALWPPRLQDPRWAAFLTANGVTPSRGGIGNDVREALGNALGYPASTTVKMGLEDIYKRYLISKGRTRYSSEDDFP